MATFRPIERQKRPREIAFIIDANTSHLEVAYRDGGTRRYNDFKNAEAALLGLRKYAVYSLVKPSQLVHFGGHDKWEVHQYHARSQRLIYRKHTTIYPLSSFGPDPQHLLPLFDAFADLGVNPSSLSTMAKNSWLRHLRKAIRVLEWRDDGAGRKAFMGGRKEALRAPANYVGAHYLDLSAAYLRAMEAPLPLHLHETQDAVWTEEGIAEAIIDIPRSPTGWQPLPIRLGTGRRHKADFSVYGWGKTRGFFVISELRNAMENHGVSVELLRVWRGYSFRTPFADWLPWAYDLRSLPGTSGGLAKAITTRLWSRFAFNPGKHNAQVLTFADPRGKDKVYTPKPVPKYSGGAKTTFLSAIIASRVRVRLLQELIPRGAVYVDTDGGIVPREITVAGWRETRIMDRLEIRAPQAFRWECPDCGEDHLPWHYSVAGIPSGSPLIPAFFEHAKPDTLWDMGPGSLALPASEIGEARKRAETQALEPAPLEGESL